LQKSTTYFWRINEKNADGTKVGDLWSFTTEMAISDAIFVSQIIPKDTLQPGEAISVSVVMKNIGESKWVSTDQFTLASQNPPLNYTWGVITVALDIDDEVLPEEEKVFTFDIKAPKEPGKYDFQWQMRNSFGWFGQLSNNVVLTVDKPVSISTKKSNNNISILKPLNRSQIIIKATTLIEPLTISIYSVTGLKIYQSKSAEKSTFIDVSNFPKGMYLVKVQSDEGFSQVEIII